MKDHHHTLSHHQVLGVSENATFEEIRTKYKQLVWHFHPDRIHDQDEKLYHERRLKEINEAYNTLKHVIRHKNRMDESETEASYHQRSSQDSGQESAQQIGNGVGAFIHRMGKRVFLSIPFHIVLMLVVFIMLFKGHSALEFGSSLFAQSNKPAIEDKSLVSARAKTATNSANIRLTAASSLNPPTAGNSEHAQNHATSTESALISAGEERVATSPISHTESKNIDIINLHQWLSNDEPLSSMVVTTSSEYTVNARADATTKSEVLEVLAPDTQLTVVGRSPNNTWLYVILPNGQRAWVFTEIVADVEHDIESLPIVHPTNMGVIAVISNEHDVNARSAPDIEAPVLKVLAADSEVVVIGRTPDSEWLHIALSEGDEAWVFTALVVIEERTRQTLSINEGPTIIKSPTPVPAVIATASKVIAPTVASIRTAAEATHERQVTEEKIVEGQGAEEQVTEEQIDVYAASMISDADGYATLPIFVSNDLTDFDIHSYQFSIQFDPTLLNFVAISNDANLSQGWRYSYQSIAPGKVQILETGETHLVGSGALINLIFQVVGEGDIDKNLILEKFTFDGISANITNNGNFAQIPDVENTENDKT